MKTGIVAAGGLAGDPRPGPLPPFVPPDVVITLAPDPDNVDYCQTVCGPIFDDLGEPDPAKRHPWPPDRRADCQIWNKEFKRVWGEKLKGATAEKIDGLELIADLDELQNHPRPFLTGTNITYDSAAQMCLKKSLGAMWETVQGLVNGPAEMATGLVKVAMVVGQSPDFVKLWNHREELKKQGQEISGYTREEFLRAVAKCKLEASGQLGDCVMKVILSDAGLSAELLNQLGQFGDLVLKSMGDAAVKELRKYRCSSPNEQIGLRCGLQARMYSEALAAFGPGEIVELFRGVEKSAEEGSKIAKVALAVKAKIAIRVPGVVKLVSAVTMKGAEFVEATDEMVQLFKQKLVGKLLYGTEYSEFAVDLSTGKPQYYVRFKSGQFARVKPDDPLFGEIASGLEKANDRKVAAKAAYDTAVKLRQKEIAAWDARHGLADPAPADALAIARADHEMKVAALFKGQGVAGDGGIALNGNLEKDIPAPKGIGTKDWGDVSGARVTFNNAADREWAKANGRLFENVRPSELPKGNRYTYVITADGKMTFGKAEDGWEMGIKHFHLANGRPVVSGGELYVDSAGNFKFNLQSGTYVQGQGNLIQSGKVTEEDLAAKTQQAFRVGIDSGTVEFVGKERLLSGKMPALPPPSEMKSICASGSAFYSRNLEFCTKILSL